MKNHGKLILGTALVGVLALVGMYLYRGYLSRRRGGLSVLNSPDTPGLENPALLRARGSVQLPGEDLSATCGGQLQTLS